MAMRRAAGCDPTLRERADASRVPLAYLKFSAVPRRKNHLDDKVKECIYIAIDANATHWYLPGGRQHIRAAPARAERGGIVRSAPLDGKIPV
jgi:hypothetical protein